MCLWCILHALHRTISIHIDKSWLMDMDTEPSILLYTFERVELICFFFFWFCFGIVQILSTNKAVEYFIGVRTKCNNATKRIVTITTARFRFVYCPWHIQILFYRINNAQTHTHTMDRTHKERHWIYVSWWRHCAHISRPVMKRWNCIYSLINVAQTQYRILQYFLWVHTHA